MKTLLEQKKIMVVKELIKTMSHKNFADQEASLNARSVLIDLIESEKTFEIFMNNDAELIGKIIELAADPSNQFNQQYLL
jgi:Mg/Co/Ni transporter MgtE